ncbi:hypothetical protein PCO31110_04710 [Pandoraea communis]|uniref:Flagella basal body P-ring formation protein FlgA SAF domain-containing protein n=2 Tax=Pandoraea communis TaxID=2508297 RepID=A0A5E4YNJ5_9BURK|nr:hypothetical protein PCO31110_04710 [Pandoraea communis]
MSVGVWLRRSLASIALCSVCVGHTQALKSADAEVRLMGQASVTRPTVKLADVAEISSDDVALQERLASIDLGPAPPVGSPARLTREALERWVNAQVGRASRVQWRGAIAVQVDTRTQALAWERLDALARRSLQDRLAGEVSDLRLTPVDRGVAVDLPPGTIDLVARDLPPGMMSAVATVWIDIRVDGQPGKTVPVNFRVEGKRRVWVALSDQSPGIAVFPAAFEMRDMPLDAVRRTPMSLDGMAQASLAATRLRRVVRAGQVLSADDVESVPDVIRGGTAMLTVTWGAVVVESPVEVLQDGRQGELIRVRPRTSSEAVLARVVGRGMLEISR